MRFKTPITKAKIILNIFLLFSYVLLIILTPILVLFWFWMNLYNWLLNKTNLDRSADKMKIIQTDQQCLNAIEELYKIDKKEWLKKYTLLFHSVFVQHTAPSPNYILNTYRGKEYKHITQFVHKFRKINNHSSTPFSSYHIPLE